MKNKSNKTFHCLSKLTVLLAILLSGFFYSCRDDYKYDNQEPEGLGSSIFDYLNDDGNYTVTVRLIKELEYEKILSLTGSKTLFVANDDAYNEFFKKNEWGVKKYEDLTAAQKKSLLKFSMLDNAYTIVKLSNYNYDGILVEETAMRQETALASIDTVSFDKGDKLPQSPYWNYYREKGIHLVKDNSKKTIAYFTEEFINKAGLTNDDFTTLTNGKTRAKGDVYVFDKKITRLDCQRATVLYVVKFQIEVYHNENIFRIPSQTNRCISQNSLPVVSAPGHPFCR